MPLVYREFDSLRDYSCSRIGEVKFMRLSTGIGIGAVVFFSVAGFLIKMAYHEEATVCIAVGMVFTYHAYKSYADDGD